MRFAKIWVPGTARYDSCIICWFMWPYLRANKTLAEGRQSDTSPYSSTHPSDDPALDPEKEVALSGSPSTAAEPTRMLESSEPTLALDKVATRHASADFLDSQEAGSQRKSLGDHPSRRRSRRWLRLVSVILACVVAGAGAAAAATYYLASTTVGRIPTAELSPGTLSPTEAGKPQNFLVLGSDSREGENAEVGAGSDREVGGRRSDTIMLLQLDPRRRKGVVLSIPRDTRVEIPGHGIDKINAAYAYGGADLAVRTVSNFTGLQIHHYIEVDFSGFISVVDVLGGVEICLDAPIRDRMSGLDIREAGCHRLNGEMALAYARSRTPEIRENGRWIPETSGDFGRIQRQQQFLKALMRQAISVNAVARWRELARAVSHGVKVDDGIDVESFLELYRRFGDLSPDRVEMLSVPGEAKTIGGVSYVVPIEPDASNLFYSLGAASKVEGVSGAGTEVPRVVQVDVRIVDASGRPGVAEEVVKRLASEGFAVVGIVKQRPSPGTEVSYERGGRQYADAVASVAGVRATFVQTRKALPTDVVLKLGSDVSITEDRVG